MNIKNIILVMSLFVLFSCSDEYFDTNTPSDSATEDQLRMSDLIGPSIVKTFKAQYYAERSVGNYSQQFTNRSGDGIGTTSVSGVWSSFYLGSFPDLKSLKNKATNKNATHFGAVADILTAINLGILTDCYGNIPYSEAGQGTENLTPAFDSQQEIYATIDSLLDAAIAALSAADSSGYSIENDLIYGGDSDKWLRAAYTLKARYQMHLLKRNGTASATAALASLANGFSSNEDDFQLNYSGETKNPWHIRQVLAKATSNDHDKIGDQLVNYMNGSIYAIAGVDPRLPVYAEKANAADPYRGYVSGGLGVSSDGNSANTDFASTGFYTSADSPMVVISYAEALFLKAEAEFIVNGGDATSTGSNTAAYSAYKDAIQANFNKLGVSGAAYMLEPSIDVGEAGLKLEHIMKEKYIANFLNPEVFVDIRRYNFSSNVYKSFDLPVNHADGEYPGEWYVRAVYPDSETTRNSDNVIANRELPTAKLWWDQ